MYVKRKSNLNLKDIMAKLDKQNGVVSKEETIYTPIAYSSSDILAARSVLNRLLARSSRNEISSINIIPKEIEES